MKTILLIICMGSLYNQAQCQDSQDCDLSGKNLREIPISNLTNITKLNLRHNNITLTLEDHAALVSYPSLTELNLSQNNITELINSSFRELRELEVLILSNNYITAIGELTFFELKNLKVLDLSFNIITHLPANIQIPSTQLQALNLQNNTLTNLDIKKALKELKTSLKITLSGNPWNCNCALISLSLWLNNNTVVLENENITLCATPKKLANYKIKEINTAQVLGCSGIDNTSSITASIPSFNNFTSLVTMPLNGTNTTSTKGNSWTFLVGVVVVGIVTSLLILIAVKFPRWYDFILSYNHHRLKEEEPYMFEEEFNVDFSMGGNDKNHEDDTVVVFEQTHTFVVEEDGFIEDKYIDERDITES